MRRGIWASVFFGAGAALLPACGAEAASKAKPQITVETVKHAIEGNTGSVQLVTFPDTGWSAVKVVRGNSPALARTARSRWQRRPRLPRSSPLPIRTEGRSGSYAGRAAAVS